MVSDKTIGTLAIVKVDFDRNQSVLENFGAFIRHSMVQMDAEVASAPELQHSLAKEFGLELPQAVVRTLLRREEKRGTISRTHGVYRIKRDRLANADLSAPIADAERQQHALVAQLRDFAANEFGRAWNSASAQTHLWKYLEQFSTRVLSAAIVGAPVPRAGSDSEGTQYIIERFVANAHHEDPVIFDFLEVVVKGKMLADSLYLGEGGHAGEVASLKNLHVYLDGPVLLDLLGHAGSELAAPTREMLDLLKDQGAIVRCFVDAAAEAESVLDAAAAAAYTGKDFYGNVVTHLVQSGKSRSDIALMSRSLQSDLLKLGVQTVNRPAPVARLTTDESRLEALLQGYIGYQNPRALKTDLDALTAIHRLREGKPASTLARSRHVFVTRNYDVFRASAKFFEQRRSGPTVPNCVLDTTLTTLVWLHQPLAAPDLPRERIIANAYAAMNPSDALWKAYSAEVEKLRAGGDISEDQASLLRLSNESSRALMDITEGGSGAYVEGTALEVLERAEAEARKDLEKDLAVEKDNRHVAEASLQSVQQATTASARRLSRLAARALFVLVLPLAVLGVVFGPLGPLNDAWSPLPDVAQALCTIVVVLLTVASVATGLSLKHVAVRVATRLERPIRSALERSQGR